jgi:predicted exporter
VSTSPPSPAVPRRWPWLALAAIAVLIAVVAAQARFSSDLQALLPANDPELNRILAFLKGRSASRLVAVEGWAEAGASTDDVREALIALPPQLRAYGAAPLAQPGPGTMVRMVDVVESHLPVLVTADQLADLAKRLEPQALVEYLRALKERATRPEDTFTATASRLDVMAVGGATMQALAAQVSGTGFADGVVSHPDGAHFLLPLDIDFDPGEVGKCEALMRALDQAVAQAATRHVHLEPIGAYRHFNDNMTSLFLDFSSTIPLGIVLIVGLLYSLTRSWTALVAMHLPAVLGVAGAVATLAVVGGNVPLPLIGFAATLLGVAVDYGIQMTAALRSGEHAHIHRPLLRSFLISACAFAALIPSPVPALHSLGIMVVGGLGVAYLVARWMLPAVVRLDPRPDPWRGVTVPLLAWCESGLTRNLIVAGLVTALLAPGLWRLRMLSDLQRMDGSKPATRAALASFLERWGSLESSNFLVVAAPGLDQALDQVAAARTALGLPPSRVERFLPSRPEQLRRHAAWNRFWSERGEAFRRDFAVACATVKLRPAAFSASLERYQPVAEPPFIAQADWAGTPLELPLSQLVSHGGEGWQVASPIDDLDQAAVRALPQRVAALKLEPVWVATRVHFAERLVEVLKGDLGTRGLIISLAIVLAVVVLVRRPRPVLAMLLPPAVALVWTFGLLGWMGEELTPFTVLVAAFVGGIGIDCAVFLAQPENRQRLISPVIACIATAICGTAAMLVAHHPLLAGVGQTLTIGMGTCLVACLLLTPVVAGRRP